MVRKKSTPTKRPVSANKCDTTGKITSKLPPRHRPGVTALRKIRQYQPPSTDTIIPKLAFQRFAREIALSINPSFRFHKASVYALQVASEDYLIDIFKEANACADHANRCTIMLKDMSLAIRIRGRRC